MDNKLNYDMGAEMGFRFGVSFALYQLKFLYAYEEEAFEYITKIVWTAYLANQEMLLDEVKRQKESVDQLSFLDNLINIGRTPVEPEPPDDLYWDEKF